MQVDSPLSPQCESGDGEVALPLGTQEAPALAVYQICYRGDSSGMDQTWDFDSPSELDP